jgi:hypothetical protein
VKKEWLAQHNMSADGLLAYFWHRVTTDVLPNLTVKKPLYVWGTDSLSNLDPSSVPAGSEFNLYTQGRE